jgi:CubicO group peptidase (beta-lactamase class C family)
MKPLYLLAPALLLTQALCAQTTAEKLAEYMDAAYKAKLFNGVVLAARNDSILLAKGYGWRDYEHHIQHDTNSLFRIGSLTKSFTAVVILYLQEHGKLKLTDNLSKYFPEYRNGYKIIIKNLLTHTSGITEYSNQDNFFETLAYKPYTQKDFWKYIKDEPLEFLPGSEFSYSNSNYFVLGYLIEKVTGKPYEQNVREIIFNKAGMTHSGFDWKNLQSPYKTVGYDVLYDSVHVPSRIADSSAAYAAGGIYTTAGDLFLFHKALIENRIISQRSQEEAYTAFQGGYGYGWYVRDWPQGKYLGHTGGIMGFSSLISRGLQDNSCIIVLSNDYGIKDKPDADLNAIAVTLLQIFEGSSTVYYIPRVAVKSNPATLPQYTGTYKTDSTGGFIIDVTVKDNLLQAIFNNGQPYKFFQEKKDFFFTKQSNCQLEFERDGNGKITDVLLYFNKRKLPHWKIK